MIWIVLSLIFAALWIGALYVEDRQREPMRAVVAAFVFGALALFPTMAIEGAALKLRFLSGFEGELEPRLWLFLGVVGPVEELLKFLPLLIFFYPRSWFDEPIDGIIYAAASATGFATAENLNFLRAGATPLEMLCRTPGGPFVHILFATYWGVAMGWAARLPAQRQRRQMLEAGLAWGATIHGLFDVITYSAGKELTVTQARMGMMLLVLTSFLALRWHMRRAQGTLATVRA